MDEYTARRLTDALNTANETLRWFPEHVQTLAASVEALRWHIEALERQVERLEQATPTPPTGAA